MNRITAKNNELWLREATEDDMMLLFCWVNDPIVRQSAFCSDEIDLTVHRQWFTSALRNEQVRIYILQRGDLPVGQVRIEYDGIAWKIDYSTAAAWRGKGYGKKLLFLLESKMEDGDCLLGEVKGTNFVSKKVFELLGYEISINGENGIYECKKYITNARDKHVSTY